MTNMESARPAQSSIRSFFQPLLHQQQQQQSKPPADSQSLPTNTARSTQNTNLPTSPPPVRSPLSYALPPTSRSTSQQLPSPPRHSNKSELPPQAAILPAEKDHITPLKRINALLLPITYPDSFYHAILAPSSPASSNFSRVITWDDKVVGGVVCRLDQVLSTFSSQISTSPATIASAGAVTEQDYHVYIQSLCLLSPYRSKGLISKALDQIVASAIEETGKGVKIKGLYAHVWTENEEALDWYKKRGFSIYENGTVNGYYRKLNPDTAYIMHRHLQPSDHLAATTTSQFESQPTLNLGGEPILSGPPTPTLPPPPNNTPYSASLAPSPTPTPLRPELRTLSSHPPPPPNNTPASLSQVPSPTSTPLPLLNQKLRPSAAPHARSFQDRGPDREWNDLPEDVLTSGSLTVPGSSAASSRSSSRSGLGDGSGTVGRAGKKKRVYPAAAFGS